MSSSWTTVRNYTHNIMSTACNHVCNCMHFCVFASKVRGHCMDTAWALHINVRVVHVPYTHAILKSLWPVLYILTHWHLNKIAHDPPLTPWHFQSEWNHNILYYLYIILYYHILPNIWPTSTYIFMTVTNSKAYRLLWSLYTTEYCFL